jgi:hypothetical protein
LEPPVLGVISAVVLLAARTESLSSVAIAAIAAVSAVIAAVIGTVR